MKIWSLVAGMVLLSLIVCMPISKCHAGAFGFLFGKKEYIVGNDIKKDDIKQFYFTKSASTNPPYFQRYVINCNAGKAVFTHEKREGDHWPLTEKDITAKGTVELSQAQWQELFSYLDQGKVTKRVESTTTGGSGPYTYLYWQGDKGEIQEFTFADLDKRDSFEALCIMLLE